MSRTGRVIHVHKYYKLKDGLWHCALDDCTHFMPKNVADRVLGKKTLCWDCGIEMRMDEDNMKTDRPRCILCVTGLAADDINAFLKSKGL